MKKSKEYLSDRVKTDQLKDCIQKYIFSDSTLRNVSSMEDVINRIERMFSDPGYLRELNISGKNWLDISTAEAIETDLAFIKSIHF